MNAALQIAGHPSVEHCMPLVSQDIDAILVSHLGL
jgi:hypothetical protein